MTRVIARAGRGADMGEEQMRLQMPAQVAEVLVRPGRPDLAIKPRLRMLAVPAQAEAVAVDAGGRFERLNALRDQRMRRLGHVVFERGGFPAIGDPAAHMIAFAYAFERSSHQCGVSDPACHPLQGNFGTFVLIFGKNPQLSVGRGPFQNDRPAVFRPVRRSQAPRHPRLRGREPRRAFRRRRRRPIASRTCPARHSAGRAIYSPPRSPGRRRRSRHCAPACAYRKRASTR